MNLVPIIARVGKMVLVGLTVSELWSTGLRLKHQLECEPQSAIDPKTASKWMTTHLDRLYSSIYRYQHAEHHQSNIAGFLLPCTRTCFVMKHWWKHEAEGNTEFETLGAQESWLAVYPPGETPDECHELVQVICTRPADDRAERDDGETKEVLLPLYPDILFPASGKKAVLHNPDSWEQLQRDR